MIPSSQTDSLGVLVNDYLCYSIAQYRTNGEHNQGEPANPDLLNGMVMVY